MDCFITNTWRISFVWHLILQIRHFLICPLHESWPTLSPTWCCSATTGLAMVAAAKPSKGREWKMRCPHCRAQFGYDSKVQPQLLAQEGLSSHTLSYHPCKNTLAFLPNPAPAQTWICTSAGPWSFCIFICLWGSKKIFMTFSKQQSSCASLKFPTWQCAGSWRRLQTKPKLWQLVWSLHLC